MPATTRPELNLASFERFESHTWVRPLKERYVRDATLAGYAIARVVKDLTKFKDAYNKKRGRVPFTTIDGRVKSEGSFFRKLYNLARERGRNSGITQEVLADLYTAITDLCGIRFSCPYYDEVGPAIERLVRPHLGGLGYATDLRDDPRYADSDRLDAGDPATGYRSYHFFIRIPTIIDIYGNSELCLCEVQARTELQHVWAVKSHDLLYKPETGWDFSDEHVAEDMRQVSNSLRAADQYLISIRDRARGKRSR